MSIDDLEMHEILRFAFPDLIQSDEGEYFDASCDANEEQVTINGETITLGQFVYALLLAAPVVEAGFSGKKYHTLVDTKQSVMLAKREA